MFKSPPQVMLKSILFIGTATTITLFSPLMIQTSSALTLVDPEFECHTANLTTSTACSGIYEGNNSNQDVSNLFSDINPNFSWTEVAKVDGDNGTSNGLTIQSSSNNGTWSYTPTNNLPVMFILKGGSSFTAYLMESGVTSGEWYTQDLLTGGKNPKRGAGLSHFSVYQAVPEPITLLGTAAATTFGVAFKKRLSSQKNQDQG